MLFITRSEINRMKKNVLPDCETEYWGMALTEFDIFENEHCYEDWHIIEDVKEEAEVQQLILLPARGGKDDSDIRGKEVRGCLYVYMRWCVGVMVVTHAVVMNDMHKKSTKKCKKVIDNILKVCYTHNKRYEKTYLES